MMFLNCPACLDSDGAVRCGLPAEVRCRFTMRSTDGPLESVMITCPAGHSFSGPIDVLTPESTDRKHPGRADLGSRAGGDRGQRGQGGVARRAHPTEPERNVRRPNTAPAYYLGYPARLWITAMRPRRERAVSRYLMEAGTPAA
jgi:hypothetical protein